MEKFIQGIALLLLGVTISAVVFGFPIMWLWNWLMPEIFGLDKITFFQAIGLFVLSNLLLKSNSYKSETK